MARKTKDLNEEVNPLFADTDFQSNVAPAEELFPETKAEPEEKAAPVPEEVPAKAELTEERKQELLAIVDAIMFEGSYSEVIKFGSKYKATFKSRTAGEDNEITQKLDGRTFNTMISYQNQSSLLTLAYSLVDLNGVNLREMEVKARYEYVTKLSSPLVIILSNLMSKFDTKVMEAMEFGKENF